MVEMSDRRFKRFLYQQAHRYRKRLEGMFGRCDQRFVFGSIRETTNKKDVPQTDFPNGFHFNDGCVVDIHISKEPWQNHWCNQATWQIAHESVHLLDPVEAGYSTFLEEGLATWFQDEPKHHIATVQEYIRPEMGHEPAYAEAKELVCRCMPQLTSAVKEIRSSGVRIQDITPDELASFLPYVDRKVIESLCRRW